MEHIVQTSTTANLGTMHSNCPILHGSGIYIERQKDVNTTEIIHFLRLASKVNENSRINFQKLKRLFITFL